VKVTAQGTKRVSMAAPICTRAGHRPRLIYRVHLERSPLNTDVSRALQDLIAARLWLTVYQLPPYAPELNPVESV
jgi:putative transposase